MENTLENKAKFFAQYWGQEVLNGSGLVYSATMKTRLSDNGDFLELKPLTSITDEEIIEVLRLAHNLKSISSEFKCAIKREKDIIHCWYVNSETSGEYHVCLNFKYATINCNLHFKEMSGDKASNHKVNIGEIHFSASRVVGYIQIVDFFRSKGFAFPYMGLPVEKLVEYGWIKLKEN
ncbi:hypothetical protein [Chryseobacterium indologenes]|uniref:hypothetical protein n=1 Tax=Chryseobacterium indologenes TaxID=253 RepID=UPI0009A199AC|nr:hypothetical protein [Chryseobacterium indologenes]